MLVHLSENNDKKLMTKVSFLNQVDSFGGKM